MAFEPVNRRKAMQLLALTMGGTAVASSALFATENKEEHGQPEPVFIPASMGKRGKIGDGDIFFKLNKKQTSGLLGTAESVLLPGTLGAPPHYHKGFDEICRVLEGTLTIMVGKELFEVDAGDWHLRPKSIVHSFWNSGKAPVRFIEMYVPGGHEAYMSDLADLFINNARPKPGDLDKLAQKYDITFVWPMLQEIISKYKVHL
ncbi:cupin domain-containing protein [Mucilaginibacter terrae]|uniref:cupin domain-containing protein n=1 Tax=Mucilaginibacter terrae TaxID=1955052 RepID=UPI0036405B41